MEKKIIPDQRCETCRHFFHHYIKIKDKYHPTDFGHCGEPRIKVRRLWDDCPRWAARPGAAGQKESAGR